MALPQGIISAHMAVPHDLWMMVGFVSDRSREVVQHDGPSPTTPTSLFVQQLDMPSKWIGFPTFPLPAHLPAMPAYLSRPSLAVPLKRVFSFLKPCGYFCARPQHAAICLILVQNYPPPWPLPVGAPMT